LQHFHLHHKDIFHTVAQPASIFDPNGVRDKVNLKRQNSELFN